MKKKFIFTIFALCIAACAVTTVGCRQNNDSSNDSSDSGQLPALEFTQTTLEMVLGESNQLPSLSLEEGETVTYSSDDSFGSVLFAILCIFAFKFPWLIIVIIAWGILKLLWIATKFVGRIAWWLLRFSAICLWWILQEVVYGIWWLVRVPITLTLDKNVPYWWFPSFWIPKW